MEKGGFTLIEVLVYLGLFAIIVGGAAVSAESLMESAQRGAIEATLEEEGDFLIAKINWALQGAQTFNAPAANTTGSALSVSKWVPTSGGNPIAILLAAGALTITEGIAPREALSNSNVVASGLTCTHAYAGGDNPESMSVSFTLSAKTPNGMSVSKTFSTVSYLRK